MPTSSTEFSAVRKSIAAPDLSPPKWANDVSGDFYAVASARVLNAVHLSADDFERETLAAYTKIAEQLRESGKPHPVRFWNHIPTIHEPMDERRDRYMVFNAARFEAFSNWYGSRDAFERQIATASGVGHHGTDLVIHCLGAKSPGVGVENPRQIPPYRYSEKFGPLPPCFARATITTPPNAPPLILVGGTASIRGEDSVHVGDLAEQTRETLDNLSSLIQKILPGDQPLHRFKYLRVYHPNPADRAALRELIEPAFPIARPIDYFQADLCRAELLVEIEGVASK